MKKLIACLMVALGAFTVASAYDFGSEGPAVDATELSPMELMQRASGAGPSPLTAGFALGQDRPPGCCKVCTVGKACGDTCISRDKECHVGPGCACDG